MDQCPKCREYWVSCPCCAVSFCPMCGIEDNEAEEQEDAE